MTLKTKIRKIMKRYLVDTVMSLRKNFPDTLLTEKGYNTMLDGATDEIITFLRDPNTAYYL